MPPTPILIHLPHPPENSQGSFVVVATDTNGLSTLPQTVSNGRQWTVATSAPGISLIPGPPWPCADQFSIVNMHEADITITVSRDGMILATKPGVHFWVNAVFHFSPAPLAMED